MKWNFETEPAELEEAEAEEVPKAKSRTRAKAKPSYIAVKGLTFDEFNARIRPGEEVPMEYLKDASLLDWLLNKKKAIKEI